MIYTTDDVAGFAAYTKSRGWGLTYYNPDPESGGTTPVEFLSDDSVFVMIKTGEATLVINFDESRVESYGDYYFVHKHEVDNPDVPIDLFYEKCMVDPFSPTEPERLLFEVDFGYEYPIEEGGYQKWLQNVPRTANA